ncbi:hypothetical protein MAUB1S_04434 [Mycolicibacterium aubagnense]
MMVWASWSLPMKPAVLAPTPAGASGLSSDAHSAGVTTDGGVVDRAPTPGASSFSWVTVPRSKSMGSKPGGRLDFAPPTFEMSYFAAAWLLPPDML